MNTETQLALFDYGTLDPESRIVVQQEDKEFDRNMADAGSSFIRACHNLLRIHTALKYKRPGFVDYCQSKPGLSWETARKMLHVAQMLPESSNILGSSKEALYLLAAPSTPESARVEAIERASNGEAISHAAAKLLVEEYRETEILQVAKEIRARKAQENAEARAAVAAAPVLVPVGKFQCIVADPPWPMEKIERDARPNQVGFDYPTMTEEQLQDLPIPELAADDCHLYLWTTHKFLPMALRLADTWGFRYQCLMTWVKNVGFTPFSWMYSTEHVLFCRKGGLPLLRLGMRLDFAAPVREHSRKPAEFYALVCEASPGPRVDLFSREAHEGFDQWGNETSKFEGSMAGGLFE